MRQEADVPPAADASATADDSAVAGDDPALPPAEPAPRSTVPDESPRAEETVAVDPTSGVRKTLRAVGSVVAPTTLIAALLYWFGEARVRTQSLDFGVDHSVFGFSNQDYVRRSVSSLYLPITFVLLIGLVWLAAHWALSRWATPSPAGPAAATRRNWLRLIVATLAVAGLVCLTVGVVTAYQRSPRYEVWPPIWLGFGVILTGYGAYVWTRFLARSRPRPTRGPDAGWVGSLCVVMVGLLVVLALFWTVSDYAQVVGRGDVDQLTADGLRRRPNVVVYSERRLHIEDAGVQETELPDDGAAGYRFRYDGLKLLLFSNGKYFLLPRTWKLDEGHLIVLSDDNSIRLEFFRFA